MCCRRIIFLSFSFFLACHFLILAQEKAEKRPTICLNMIVKNESRIICRCLESVLPVIDYWVIVDTGSDDGTQKIIKDFMKSKNVPGELYERPWKNFGHNRNEALELAFTKADYILFIDADEQLKLAPDFSLPRLTKDYYYIYIDLDNQLLYKRVQLISTKKPWKWVGDMHEVLQPSLGMTQETLKNITIFSTHDGDRSQDPQKYAKDAAVLEKALAQDPENTRYTFYLAQSYRDAGKQELALKYYEKRVAMGGWDEELFWSKLQIAILREQMNAPQDTVISAYKEAYVSRPTRAEPLYYLANYLRRMKDYQSCYDIAKIGMTIPIPEDVLFIQKWMYDYGLTLECSVGAYWTGLYSTCQKLSLKILDISTIPNHVRECVLRNLGFANLRLLEEALANESEKNKEAPAA